MKKREFALTGLSNSHLTVRAPCAAAALIHVWTINGASDAIGLWYLGVQGILSDAPGTILAARSRAAAG